MQIKYKIPISKLPVYTVLPSATTGQGRSRQRWLCYGKLWVCVLDVFRRTQSSYLGNINYRNLPTLESKRNAINSRLILPIDLKDPRFLGASIPRPFLFVGLGRNCQERTVRNVIYLP